MLTDELYNGLPYCSKSYGNVKHFLTWLDFVWAYVIFPPIWISRDFMNNKKSISDSKAPVVPLPHCAWWGWEVNSNFRRGLYSEFGTMLNKTSIAWAILKIYLIIRAWLVLNTRTHGGLASACQIVLNTVNTRIWLKFVIFDICYIRTFQ